jgi:hypothetical protein
MSLILRVHHRQKWEPEERVAGGTPVEGTGLDLPVPGQKSGLHIQERPPTDQSSSYRVNKQMLKNHKLN